DKVRVPISHRRRVAGVPTMSESRRLHRLHDLQRQASRLRIRERFPKPPRTPSRSSPGILKRMERQRHILGAFLDEVRDQEIKPEQSRVTPNDRVDTTSHYVVDELRGLSARRDPRRHTDMDRLRNLINRRPLAIAVNREHLAITAGELID